MPKHARVRLTQQGICSYFVLMPESSGRPRRGVVWKLSNAHDVGQLVRIECGYCNIKRDYKPDDIQRLVGDVGVDDVPRQMRCEKCRRAENLRAVFWSPTGQELAGLRIRRLVDIKMVRKVIWRDEWD